MKIHIEIFDDKDEKLFSHYNDNADLYSFKSVILMISYLFMQLQEHETIMQQIETKTSQIKTD